MTRPARARSASHLASALALLAALALVAPAAQAGMRCDRDLVREGDTKTEVLLACGKPLFQEVVGLADVGNEELVIEHWTYARGPGKFVKLVVFQGGVVESIEDIERQ